MHGGPGVLRLLAVTTDDIKYGPASPPSLSAEIHFFSFLPVTPNEAESF